jgi:hypothetical protein
MLCASTIYKYIYKTRRFALPFPSIPSTPAFIPTDAQKDAFSFLKNNSNPASRFANPLSAPMSSLSSGIADMGGLGAPVQSLQSLLNSAVAAGTNPNPLNPIASITQAQADEVMQCLAPMGFDQINTIAPALSGAQGALAAQSASVIPNMSSIISASSSYSTTAEMFGDTPTICDGLKDLLGSLGGAADELMASVSGALGSITEMFGSISASVRGIFTNAISALQSALGGSGGVFGDISQAISDIKNNITSFVSMAAGELGKTVSELRGLVSAAVDSIKEGLSDVAAMITDEISKIGEVFDYLKNAGMAMSWPSLNPCAKNVMKNVCGAAGAGPLVALVS